MRANSAGSARRSAGPSHGIAHCGMRHAGDDVRRRPRGFDGGQVVGHGFPRPLLRSETPPGRRGNAAASFRPEGRTGAGPSPSGQITSVVKPCASFGVSSGSVNTRSAECACMSMNPGTEQQTGGFDQFTAAVQRQPLRHGRDASAAHGHVSQARWPVAVGDPRAAEHEIGLHGSVPLRWMPVNSTAARSWSPIAPERRISSRPARPAQPVGSTVDPGLGHGQPVGLDEQVLGHDQRPAAGQQHALYHGPPVVGLVVQDAGRHALGLLFPGLHERRPVGGGLGHGLASLRPGRAHRAARPAPAGMPVPADGRRTSARCGCGASGPAHPASPPRPAPGCRSWPGLPRRPG